MAKGSKKLIASDGEGFIEKPGKNTADFNLNFKLAFNLDFLLIKYICKSEVWADWILYPYYLVAKRKTPAKKVKGNLPKKGGRLGKLAIFNSMPIDILREVSFAGIWRCWMS